MSYQTIANFYSDNSKPIMPMIISPRDMILMIDTGSLNQIMPITAIKAVPRLAQIA